MTLGTPKGLSGPQSAHLWNKESAGLWSGAVKEDRQNLERQERPPSPLRVPSGSPSLAGHSREEPNLAPNRQDTRRVVCPV